MFLRKIYYSLSPNLRLIIRRIYYLPIDTLNLFRKRENQVLQPPKGMIFTGAGDFIKQGEFFLKYFIEYGELKPNDYVLDIGSGIGRMAIPLTTYLSKEGKYEGFDIVKKGVTWCQKNISTKFSNFNFQHINLKNTLYNLNTNQEAAKFKFPYADNHFDFIFLISVFTHMLPHEVENYIEEIKRVLKDSGTCFATFFLIDESSTKYLPHNTNFSFPYNMGNYYVMDKKVPEANVAYNLEFILTIFKTHGFKIKSKYMGYWYGGSKEKSFDFQDILIVKKEI